MAHDMCIVVINSSEGERRPFNDVREEDAGHPVGDRQEPPVLHRIIDRVIWSLLFKNREVEFPVLTLIALS